MLGFRKALHLLRNEFCRNDLLKIPIIYESNDNGENWSKPMSHNIPFLNSKIYSGTLSDGKLYVIYTAGKTVDNIAKRGAVVSVIPLDF